MWVWVTLFLIVTGLGMVGLGQTALMMVLGSIAFITGVAVMIFGVDKEVE